MTTTEALREIRDGFDEVSSREREALTAAAEALEVVSLIEKATGDGMQVDFLQARLAPAARRYRARVGINLFYDKSFLEALRMAVK